MNILDYYDKFTIEETVGVDRHGETVTFGLPFAQGEWPEEQKMGLSCHAARGSGSIRSAHWNIEQRWDDKSVRLAFCSAVLDVDAQSILIIEPDPDINPDSPDSDVKIGENPGVNPSGFYNGVSCQITAEGQTERVEVVPEQPSLSWSALQPKSLHNNIFEITGHIKRSGDTSITLAVTIRNATAQPRKISRLRCRIDTEQLLGTSGETGQQIEYQRRGIRKETEDHPEILQLSQDCIYTADTMEPVTFTYPIGGECRQNLVFARCYSDELGVNVAVRNFGENFPVKLSLGEGAVYFDLWPEEAGVFEWPGGVSKTYEIGFTEDSGGQAGGGLLYLFNIQYPLAATIPVSRLALLSCFPDFAPYIPKKYAKLEYWVKWVLANRPRSFGFMHFGDEPNFGYTARSIDPGNLMYTNNEYDFPLIGLTQFCRTGDRLWYEDGRAAVLHMMDIDSVTASEDPSLIGGQYAHAVNHGHDAHYAAPDHEWLEGLLLWHVITGDQRALARAKALADRFVRLAQRGDFDNPGLSARRYGWPLIGLSAFYGFSRDQRYLDAAGRIVAGMKRVQDKTGGLRAPYWGTPYQHRDTFMIGIATAALTRYHKLTQDEAVGEMVINGCEDIMKNQSPEDIFYYKNFPMVRLPEPISSTISLEALAYGYTLTKNRDYITAGVHNLEALLTVAQSGIVMDWNAENRESYTHGASMRAQIVEVNTQMTGLVVRGLWPFLSRLEAEGFLTTGNNPFSWTFTDIG